MGTSPMTLTFVFEKNKPQKEQKEQNFLFFETQDFACAPIHEKEGKSGKDRKARKLGNLHNTFGDSADIGYFCTDESLFCLKIWRSHQKRLSLQRRTSG